jgi:hypothetical protein
MDDLDKAIAELRTMCDHVPGEYADWYWQTKVEHLLSAIDAQQPVFYAHAGFLRDFGEKNSGPILVTRQPTPNSVALYRGLK